MTHIGLQASVFPARVLPQLMAINFVAAQRNDSLRLPSCCCRAVHQALWVRGREQAWPKF
jgi:hypothetical protein